MRVRLVAQGGPGGLSIAAALREEARASGFDRLDVAAAYATLQGVRGLERALDGLPVQSRWVVGLDDAVTQPAALDRLAGLAGAELRVATLSPQRRFHPKVYRLWSSQDVAASLLLVGSGNLTERGLHENAEGAALLSSDSSAEADAGSHAFEEFWALGRPATAERRAAYRARYDAAAPLRRQARLESGAPVEPAEAAPVSDALPAAGARTSESVFGLAVARLAAARPDQTCPIAEAIRLMPGMVALTPEDWAPSSSQGVPKWHQVLRNIRSNAPEAGPASNNPIARGYLAPAAGAFRLTDSGRAMLAARGFTLFGGE